MIDLRSDTVTTPTQAMREFMMAAEVGDDVFNEDPTVNQLQEMIAEMTGKERAIFVPSGTQGNQVAVNAHTRPGQEIICDYNSHIFNYESGSAAMLSGAQLHPILGQNGHPRAEQIAEVIRPLDDHYPQTGLICLENTHNRAGGTIFPLAEIKKISALAEKHKLPLHLDGARLWNASVASNISIAEWTQHVDSVSLCFSKGLGAPVGSIVAGAGAFIDRVHFYRKAYGGGMRQVGILAAACIFAVENHFDRLQEDHGNARLLGTILNDFKGINVIMPNVQTNIVIADVSKTGRSAVELADLLYQAGLASIPFGRYKIRFVTHMLIKRDHIIQCKDIIKKVIV